MCLHYPTWHRRVCFGNFLYSMVCFAIDVIVRTSTVWSSSRIMWLVMVRLHPYIWWFFNSILLGLVYTPVMLAGQLWSSYVRPVPSLPSPLPGLSPMSRQSTTLILLRPSCLQTFCYVHFASRHFVMTILLPDGLSWPKIPQTFSYDHLIFWEL